ncbi:MAG TPA: peptide chain release factor N(5)-glutamine methyltransferase [Candidatus Xenobia bacterium]|jgi:release factor glutamine methyltransferase
MIVTEYAVGQLLDGAARTLTTDTARLDAEVLLASVLDVTRTALHIHPERPVPPTHADRFRELLRRRIQGEPVAYLVGQREFMSLDFEVTRDTLIPRADTEILVEYALERLRLWPGPLKAADVGTGSGVIAIALADAHPRLAIWATDISPAALEVARRNALRHQAGVTFLHTSLLEDVPGDLDMVVSNPPYVSEAEFPQLGVGVRRYEPKSALVAGASGLELYPPLARQAWERLRPGGVLAVEVAPWQRDAVLACFAAQGFHGGRCLQDLAGLARVITADRPGGS